ncbi:hypothetical protein GS429_19595 [Natronorubrum sp. JWXQ-INN-674]|uniref:Uncharacterized protein n=1 Tax=Natronorubrum halalkaliphilum TaxID=2691917 RepID=A0A6B0VRR7_9EURY|nr:twin-arginine translocation signal domain-containing protein [Natronorubrum halalkaliphilum]MXV64228.1 hypothetical protein [Natronorubrum halalkaliphilum]
MKRPNPRSRRTFLRIGGVAAAAGILAGCTEGGGDPGETDRDDERESEEDEQADPPEDDWDEEWDDVETIEFDASEDGWVGRRPSVIEDIENPDIALYEGSEYEFLWTNRDGSNHNFAIWDEDGPAEATSFVEEEGETTSLTVEATEEMEIYLCEAHEDDMVGSIEVRSE